MTGLTDRRTHDSPDPIVMGRDIARYLPVVALKWFNFASDPIVGGTKNPHVYAAGPRIVLQAIRNLKLPRRLVGSWVDSGTFTIGTVHNIIVRKPVVDWRALLGILNSSLMNQYYAAHFPEHRIKGAYLDSLPIVTREGERKHATLHDEIAQAVTSMITLQTRAASAAHPQEKEQLQRRVQATDRQIDELVYQLYGLTNEEIRMIEAPTALPEPAEAVIV